MSGPSVQPTYQPRGQGQADASYMGGIQSVSPYVTNLPGQVIPQYQGLTNQILSNPYAGQAQGVVNQTAGGITPYLSGLSSGIGGLTGLGQAGAGYGQQALQAGFDPQNQLHDQLYGQTRDAANVTNAQYGLSTSPYGAGLTNQALTNFDLGWQNQQLQRQGQAAQTYGSIAGGMNSAYGGAASLGESTLGLGIGAGQAPSSAYTSNLNQGISALGNLEQGTQGAVSPAMGFMNSLAQYLGIGQQATGQQNQNSLQKYGYQMQGMEGLGQLAGSAAMFAFL